jgi:predicted anti-sigma-YlaC factor YlaD
MLQCQKVRRALSESLDGTLPLKKRVLLRLHLWLCRRCRAVDHSLRYTQAVLRKLANTPPLADDLLGNDEQA